MFDNNIRHLIRLLASTAGSQHAGSYYFNTEDLKEIENIVRQELDRRHLAVENEKYRKKADQFIGQLEKIKTSTNFWLGIYGVKKYHMITKIKIEAKEDSKIISVNFACGKNQSFDDSVELFKIQINRRRIDRCSPQDICTSCGIKANVHRFNEANSLATAYRLIRTYGTEAWQRTNNPDVIQMLNEITSNQ